MLYIYYSAVHIMILICVYIYIYIYDIILPCRKPTAARGRARGGPSLRKKRRCHFRSDRHPQLIFVHIHQLFRIQYTLF